MKRATSICLTIPLLAVATGCTPGESAHGGRGLELTLATYLGGKGNEQIRDVETDADGNIYVTGGTGSRNFPVTDGAFQTKFNPGKPEDGSRPHDVFVTKLAPDGGLLWSTFLGGPNYDRAYAIEIGPGGAVWVAGRAGAGFPVTDSAAQREFRGGGGGFYGPQDGFVAKLSPDGARLEWATYFGTDDPQIIRDLAVGPDGEAYVGAGYRSGTYPSGVARAFTGSPAGGADTVAARLSPDGERVEWARFLGGSGDEGVTPSIRIGKNGGVYVATLTRSSDAPTTAGAYDRSFGGSYDFYVVRLDAKTGKTAWAGYLGGKGMDDCETHGLAIDEAGNAYVSGTTTSTDFPTTAGAFQRRHAGSGGRDTGKLSNYHGDMVVAKLSADGARLLAATFVGGSAGDGAEGIALDADGNVHLSGATHSKDFPVTADAFQRRLAGKADFVAVTLSGDLSRLVHAGYLGGPGIDYGRAVATDAAGALIVAGELESKGWPAKNAIQPKIAGGIDAALARFAREQKE